MVLENMVGPEDVDEDLEFEVRDECSKYGSVQSIIIHEVQHRLVGDEATGNVSETSIKIFVEFTSQAGDCCGYVIVQFRFAQYVLYMHT